MILNTANTSFEATYFSVAEIRGIDRAAIDEEGIAGYALMTRAAQAALDVVRAHHQGGNGWVFLCGSGNNGGDAYVMARLAHAEGIDVCARWLSDPSELGGDARRAYEDFRSAGLSCEAFTENLPGDTDLIVDGMLGSGLVRDVSGGYRAAVEWANAHPAPVMALDIPTGLHGDDGRVLGVAIRAEWTVTFVGLKTGLVLGEGPDHCGKVTLATLNIPESCRSGANGVFRRLEEPRYRQALAPRARDAHKGQHGHVVIVGGGPGMSGAARIAGEAALRSGAGLVSIVTHPEHAAGLNEGRPELMVRGVEDAADARSLLAKADVVGVGPGLGQDQWAASLVREVLLADKPLVIDADGLTLLASTGSTPPDAILTPHPGEAARLLGQTARGIQAGRLAALDRLADRYQATIVLKGAGTLVSSRDGLPWICTAGNPGMASAGMGDALTGIVASFRGQGLGREAAAILGATVHARAGDRAAIAGQRGLLALDLVDAIRSQVNP